MGAETARRSGLRDAVLDHARRADPLLLVASATVVLSITIALAPGIGPYPVAAASVLWLAAVGLLVGLSAGRFRSFQLAQWILVGATALAAIRMSSLGVIQLVMDRPALFWNVDWRYAATQALGITRFGGLQDSLDYAGEPVRYHVGPSWIAGALDHVTGLPANGVLLVAVPAACTVVVASCSYGLLRLLGASVTASAIAPTVMLSLPTNPYALLRRVYGSFRDQASLWEVATDAEQWWFSPALMLNSLFALAVGLSAAYLLVGPARYWRLVVGGVGVASLLAIKPQYAVGFVAVLGLGLLIEGWRRAAPGSRGPGILVLGGALAVGAAVASALNPSAFSLVGVELSIGPGLVRAVDPRASVLPVLTLVAMAPLLSGRWRPRSPAPLLTYTVGAVVGAVVLVLTLEATTFLVDAGAVAQANEVGLPYGVASQDLNLSQADRPAMVVLVLLATALVVALVQTRAVPTRWITTFGVVMVAMTLPVSVAPLAQPDGAVAYEVSDEADLDTLMSTTDVDEGIWLANDLADPAGDFARPLRATNLTSFSPAQFFVSNVAYMRWTEPDVVDRVRSAQRFYETPWSSWHREFLVENGISHVIIRDRCPTAWPAGRAGAVIGTQGSWTLVIVEPVPAEPPAQPWVPSGRPGVPLYGLSGCLDGSGPQP
jgi:hypothetical protein